MAHTSSIEDLPPHLRRDGERPRPYEELPLLEEHPEPPPPRPRGEHGRELPSTPADPFLRR